MKTKAAEKRPIARKARMRGGEFDGEKLLVLLVSGLEEVAVDVGWGLDDMNVVV